MLKFFFTETVNSWDEVVYFPTLPGYICILLFIALLIFLLTRFLKQKQKKITVKQLSTCGIAISISMVLSVMKLFELPNGGSITTCSMLFICFIGYCYGIRIGLVAAIAYGTLQFISNPYMYSIPQILLDYPLAFGALGLSGIFSNKKYGLYLGYITGVFGRFVFSFLSGILFFAHYAPEGTHVIIYSLTYNGSYLFTEAVITLIIIAIPPVSKGLSMMKKEAIS